MNEENIVKKVSSSIIRTNRNTNKDKVKEEDSNFETINNQNESFGENASFEMIELKDKNINNNDNDNSNNNNNDNDDAIKKDIDTNKKSNKEIKDNKENANETINIYNINSNVNEPNNEVNHHEPNDINDLNEDIYINKEMSNYLIKSHSTININPKPQSAPKPKPHSKANSIMINKSNTPTSSTIGIVKPGHAQAQGTGSKGVQKKTKETKLSEELMDKLYKNGKMPNTLGYNYLIPKGDLLVSNPTKTLQNINNSSIDYKDRNKTIQEFLLRNKIYLSQKQLNMEKNKEAAVKGPTASSLKDNNNKNKTNGVSIKPKFATIESSSRSSLNNCNKQFKGKIRSLDKFKSDQDQLEIEKNERLEAKRKELEELQTKGNKIQPTISLNSKKIASRRIQSSKEKKENIHTKLYKETKVRTLSKEKKIRDHITTQDEMNKKNQIKSMSKEEINSIVEKLHKEGAEDKKKREKTAIPCHMEEVSVFFNREYSNYKSNIRTNTSKQKDIIEAPLNDYYDMSRAVREEDKVKNNKMILMKKLLKEIDDSIKAIEFQSQLGQFKDNEGDKDKDKETVNAYIDISITFNQYCLLMFYIGMLQYNHYEFLNLINTTHSHCPNKAINKEKVETLTYEKIKWDDIKLNDIIIKRIPSSNKATPTQVIKEYKKLKTSWSLLVKHFNTNTNSNSNDNNNNDSNIVVELNKVKLFLFSIIGIYSGELSEKKTKPLSSSMNNILKSKNSNDNKNNKKIKCESLRTNSNTSQRNLMKKSNSVSDYVNTLLLQNNPPLSFDKKKVDMIYSSYEQFSKNRTEYEHYLRKETNKKRLMTYASHPEMTFKPVLNNNNNISTTIKSSESQLTIEAKYNLSQKKKQNQRAFLLKEKELKELKDCTFTPNTNSTKGKYNEVSMRLYSYAKPKKGININTTGNNINNDNDKSKEEQCSFSPKLNPPLSNRLFSGKSIKDNPKVSIKIDQYEKARIEKKLNDFIAKQGGRGLVRMMTAEDLLEFERAENFKQFEFGIERKSNKFTFEAFSNKEKTKRYNSKMNLPLFTIEVKIKNHIELLEYYKDDDPTYITKRFCRKNNLGENSKEKIISVIEEKLKSMETTSSNLAPSSIV